MPGWVEVDAEFLAGLELAFARAQCQDPGLAGIEVGNVKVDVGLLGVLGARPDGRLIVINLLEGDCRACRTAQMEPIGPFVQAFDLPVQDRSIELGKSLRVRAVEGDQRKHDGLFGHVSETTRSHRSGYAWLLRPDSRRCHSAQSTTNIIEPVRRPSVPFMLTPRWRIGARSPRTSSSTEANWSTSPAMSMNMTGSPPRIEVSAR